MAEIKAAGRPGRKAPDGTKKQFLSSIDPAVIRAIKVAAGGLDNNASQVLKAAVKEGRERCRAGKR